MDQRLGERKMGCSGAMLFIVVASALSGEFVFNVNCRDGKA